MAGSSNPISRRGLWVLIPVKGLVNAKQRLSAILSPGERRALSLAMVEDMLRLLASVVGIDGVLLVAGDSMAEPLASRYRASLLVEHGRHRGLNAAVSQGAAYLSGLGASHMLVLHGDLPLIAADDISFLIAGLPPRGQAIVRLVPDTSREGSNALLCSLPAPIDFAYGQHSFELHRQACQREQVTLQQFLLDSVALDIDTPRDLQALLEQLEQCETAIGKTAAVLARCELATRLGPMRLEGNSDSVGSCGGLGVDSAR